MYWTASIVEWNISESFCLCILLVSLFFEKEWILICCPLLQSKIGLHKTPQAAQALAPHADVKGILRGSSSHSSSIPPESPLGRLRGRLPKLSPYKWFQKRTSSTEKNISLVACNAAEKYVKPLYAREIYFISTGLGKKILLWVNHPYLPSKVYWSTPNH